MNRMSTQARRAPQPPRISSRRLADPSRDKPQVDRVEHANLDRPGAYLHPRAYSGDGPARSRGWAVHGRGPQAWPVAAR